MATKETAEKSNANFLWKLADKVAGSFIVRIPAAVPLIYKATKGLTTAFTNEGWDNWADKLVTEGLIDQDTADRLKPLARYSFPWGGILMILTLLKVKMTDMSATLDIYALDRQYDIMAQTTPHPAPVDNLVRSMIIDPGRATENRAQLKKHGYSDLQIDNIILSYYRTVDEGTLRTLFLRGKIDTSKLYERMRELGYTDTRTAEIIQTWVVLPGPQDLFMMVAKEAFEPDIYTALGLDDEFPVEQVKWLEQQGISREWAEKYWIAHWDQPSIGQGFEMLHRNVIKPPELDMLFRAIEIPLFWRDKLTKIAYRPYTRVDVRRMHAMDELKDADLIVAYMDQGYDADKALKMANFSIKLKADGETQLTRAAILESFRESLITRSQAVALLVEQNYDNDLADYYIELEEFRRDKKLRDQKIDNLRDQFLLSQISQSAVRDQLNQLDLRGEKVDSLMETWALDAYKYAAIPSKSDLDSFLSKGIISEGQYRDYMARHGFSAILTSWYLEDMQPGAGVRDRLPTKADLGKWYKKMTILEDRYRSEMALLGYSDDYIDLYFNSL